MAKYNQVQRKAALAAMRRRRGRTVQQISAQYGVPVSTLQLWWQQERAQAKTAAAVAQVEADMARARASKSVTKRAPKVVQRAAALQATAPKKRGRPPKAQAATKPPPPARMPLRSNLPPLVMDELQRRIALALHVILYGAQV